MSYVTLARDDFYKLITTDDFFTANPAFAPIEQAVADCKTAYEESRKKKKCSCGGSPSLIFGCLDATLALAETLRVENPAALTTLLEFLRLKRNDPSIAGFTLYYRKTSQEPLVKVRFP